MSMSEPLPDADNILFDFDKLFTAMSYTQLVLVAISVLSLFSNVWKNKRSEFPPVIILCR